MGRFEILKLLIESIFSIINKRSKGLGRALEVFIIFILTLIIIILISPDINNPELLTILIAPILLGINKHIRDVRKKNPKRESESRLYKIREDMKYRADNKNSKDYKNYGAKGRKYDPKRADFQNFKKDMGKSYEAHVKKRGEEKTTLERIHNTLGYSKRNCKRADRNTQNHTKRIANQYTVNDKNYQADKQKFY